MQTLKLSTEQLHIVDMFIAGESVAIHSRAGAGKTATLVACLMAEPQRAIALAFMNKAVQEIQERLGDKTHHRVATLNSAGFTILKDYWDDNHVPKSDRLQADDKKYYTIVDEVLPKADYATKRAIVDAANYCRANMVHPDDRNHIDEVASRFWINLNITELRALSKVMMIGAERALGGYVDFEDMIWVPVLKQLYPKERFPVVAIDEAQDLTTAKRMLAQMFLEPGGKVLVAGDRAQSIQGWAGAERDSFDAIVGIFDCQEVTLSKTHRFGPTMAALVKPIVPDIEGIGTGLDQILQMESIGTTFFPGKCAIISRYNSTLIELAMEYYKRRIPCKLKKDSVVQEIINSANAIRRPKNFRYEHFDTWVGVWLNEKRAWAAAHGGLTEWVEKMTQHAELLKRMKATSNATNVKELIDEIEFLCRSETGPVLITAHSAKGSEYDNVYILEPQNFDPGSHIYPNQAEINEAFNLLYVAYTRARDRLILVSKGKLVA